MVEVHLYSLRCNLEYNARDNSSNAVQHRNSVAWYEKVFSYLAVDLERSLRKVDHSVWVDFTVCICCCECNVELAAWLHALDMLLKFREKVSCSVDIVKWFLYSLVNYHSFNFEFVCELDYFVLSDFHIVSVLIFIVKDVSTRYARST